MKRIKVLLLIAFPLFAVASCNHGSQHNRNDQNTEKQAHPAGSPDTLTQGSLVPGV